MARQPGWKEHGTMKFVFGLALGALGMWAYRTGKLQEMMGGSAADAWQPAVERFNQVANSEQVRNVASTVQDRMQQARTAEIATPMPAEVAGRPSEPLPTQGG
jgi:hypothetical protein